MEIMPLFPTPIGKQEFRSLKEAELNVVQKQLQYLKQNIGNKITQNFNLLDTPGLEELKVDITTCINTFFHNIYKPDPTFKLYITNSWCNVTSTGEHHHPHHHFNSIVSGVLYLHARNNDCINFSRKDYGLGVNIYPVEETPFNHLNETIDVSTGVLLLFPSTLIHSVPTVERFGERVSLSFNTFFTGYVGSRDTLSELYIK